MAGTTTQHKKISVAPPSTSQNDEAPKAPKVGWKYILSEQRQEMRIKVSMQSGHGALNVYYHRLSQKVNFWHVSPD
jgi:hypothetical protein